MKKILVIHGPNLNLLGIRETDVYGKDTLDTINDEIKKMAEKLKVGVAIIQSNHEGELVDAIGKAIGNYEGIIINPAAYTHTSVAIRDAIAGVRLPCIEVHLSNIYARENFRHNSLIAPVSIGQVSGFGKNSYTLALKAMVDFLK